MRRGRDIHPSVTDAVFYEDEFWILGYWMNGLFKLSKDCSKLEFICDTHDEECDFPCLYSRIINYGHFMILLPQNTYNIAIYDIDKKILIKKELPCEHNSCGYGVADYILEDNLLYLFSTYKGFSPYIINLDDFTITEISGLKEIIEAESLADASWLLSATPGKLISYKGCYYIAFYETGKVMELTLPDCKTRVITLKDDYKIDRLFHAGDGNLWLIPTDGGSKAIYNLQQRAFKEFDLMRDGEIADILLDKNNVFLIGKSNGIIGKYDTANDKLERIELKQGSEYFHVHTNERWFSTSLILEGYLYLFPNRASQSIVRVDLATGDCEFILLSVNENVGEYYDFYDKHIGDRENEYDERYYSLSNFLKYTVMMDEQ